MTAVMMYLQKANAAESPDLRSNPICPAWV